MLAERQLVKGHIKEGWFALLFSLESMKIRQISTISDLLLFGQTASSSGNMRTRAFLNKDNPCISVNLLSLTCTENYKKTCVQKKNNFKQSSASFTNFMLLRTSMEVKLLSCISQYFLYSLSLNEILTCRVSTFHFYH